MAMKAGLSNIIPTPLLNCRSGMTFYYIFSNHSWGFRVMGLWKSQGRHWLVEKAYKVLWWINWKQL